MLTFIDYDSEKTTVILKSTSLAGNVKADGDLFIAGEIKGNVSSSQLIYLTGLVQGKIESRNLFIDINGIAAADMIVDYDVCINGVTQGNIKCRNIEINGRVKGDIYAENSVIIGPSAEVSGDIICKDLSVESGGVINGNVKLRARYLNLE